MIEERCDAEHSPIRTLHWNEFVSADGADHRFRKLVAQRIIQCAKTGMKTLGGLTKAGERFVRSSRRSA